MIKSCIQSQAVLSPNPVHSQSLPRWVFCPGSSCISSPGRCCVCRSMRFLQALIPLRHRVQTTKLSRTQVQNATTYNNFRVLWRTVLVPIELRAELPLFTELPRRVLLGEGASAKSHSRKPNSRHEVFSETKGIRRINSLDGYMD